MGIVDRLLRHLAPHDCLGCGMEGYSLCPDCLRQLPLGPERCYRCHTPARGSFTCSECRRVSNLYRVSAATTYESIAKQLVWKLKFASAEEAARIMARHMASRLRDSSGTAIIVPVPTATSHVRWRGYDQAKLLAGELSKQTGLPYLPCLVRTSQAHQLGASRSQRLVQLQTAFRVIHPHRVRGADMILVDDVVTTGATLEAAARCLDALGARHIEALVFCTATEKHLTK